MADVNPLISIVMLCYNHERYVAEALEGVLAQTYAPLDIVIIDDCSQDTTAEIVAAKLAALPTVRTSASSAIPPISVCWERATSPSRPRAEPLSS